MSLPVLRYAKASGFVSVFELIAKNAKILTARAATDFDSLIWGPSDRATPVRYEPRMSKRRVYAKYNSFGRDYIDLTGFLDLNVLANPNGATLKWENLTGRSGGCRRVDAGQGLGKIGLLILAATHSDSKRVGVVR